MTSPCIRIRLLSAIKDTSALQAVLEGAPRYSLNVSGALQPANAAEEVFRAVPADFDASRKFVFGIQLHDELIGCMDVLRGFPTSGKAMLGLLLLKEKNQGQGSGREAYRLLESQLREWPEIKTMRISVVETNGEVLGFWERLGFSDTDERHPYECGTVVSQALSLIHI